MITEDKMRSMLNSEIYYASFEPGDPELYDELIKIHVTHQLATNMIMIENGILKSRTFSYYILDAAHTIEGEDYWNEFNIA